MSERDELTPEQYAYYIGVNHGRTAEDWRWSDDEIRRRARYEFPQTEGDPHDATAILWAVIGGKLCYARTGKDRTWCEYPATLGSWIAPSPTRERCELWQKLFAASAVPNATPGARRAREE